MHPDTSRRRGAGEREMGRQGRFYVQVLRATLVYSCGSSEALLPKSSNIYLP